MAATSVFIYCASKCFRDGGDCPGDTHSSASDHFPHLKGFDADTRDKGQGDDHLHSLFPSDPQKCSFPFTDDTWHPDYKSTSNSILPSTHQMLGQQPVMWSLSTPESAPEVCRGDACCSLLREPSSQLL